MTMYATTKNAKLHIAADNGTYVSFPAFLSSFSITADYGVSLEKIAAASDLPIVAQGATIFNYSLAIDIPSTTLNEAIENYKNIQMLINGVRHPNNPRSFKEYTNYFYVSLSNLIQNGNLAGPKVVRVTNSDETKFYGVKCIIATITNNPAVDMGFFEHNGYQYPKSYTLNLELLVKSDFTTNDNSKYIAASFNKKGKYNPEDTKYWPFGIKVFSLKNANDILRAKNGSDGSQIYAVNKGAMIGFAEISAPLFTSFEAFLDDISFKREATYSQQKNDGTALASIEIGSGLKDNSYSLSFNCVAHSLNEAMTNLVKLQHLLRFPIKNEENDDESPDPKGEVFAYLQNLISINHSPSFGKQLDLNLIKNSGVLCAITSLELMIENDMGYFDYKSFFIPKVIKVSMGLTMTDAKAVDQSGQSLGKKTNAKKTQNNNINPNTLLPKGRYTR